MKEHVTSALIWLSVYFMPVYPCILILGFFMFCDYLTGAGAAIKIGGWKEYKSKKMRHTVIKLIEYGVGILVAHVIQKEFLQDIFPALKVVSGFIAYIELKSINENIEKSTGVNLFKNVLGKLKK